MREAVEKERDDITVSEPKARSRLFAVPSGLLMFACLFLPMVQPCAGGDPSYAHESWVTALPHLIALIVAAGTPLPLGALVGRPWRARRNLAIVEIIWWALVAGWYSLIVGLTGALYGASLSLVATVWLLIAAAMRMREIEAEAVVSLPAASVVGRPRPSRNTGALLAAMIASIVVASVVLPHRRADDEPDYVGPGFSFWNGC